MKICSLRHKEVSFNSEVCPVCETRDKKKTIPITFILKEIEHYLENIECWYKERISWNILSSEEGASTLLTLLETFMVGQVGGFDVGQTNRTLKGRYKWLKEKHNAPSP